MTYTLKDHDGPEEDIIIELQVDCPDFHSKIGVTFNSTLVEVPEIYYDMNTMTTMLVPVNTWILSPNDVDYGIICFTITQHYMKDLTDNSVISYISVNDFNLGLLEIQQTDPTYSG